MTSLSSPYPPPTPPGSYCCGYNSRACTVIASSVLLAGGCFYVAVGIVALGDKSNVTSDQRIIFQVLIAVMSFQIMLSALAIWGARSYKAWPVKGLLVWISLSIVFNFVGMIVTRNVFMLLGVFLQLLLFWRPVYRYLQDYEQLQAMDNKQITSNLAVLQRGAGYSDEAANDEEMDGVELV